MAKIKTLKDINNETLYPQTVAEAVAVEGGFNLEELLANMEKRILDKQYPVGSVYISTTLATPQAVSDAIGGEWEAWGQGRLVAGVGTTTDAAGNAINMSNQEKGGQKTHVHTLPANTGSTSLTVSQMPSHSHTINSSIATQGSSNSSNDKIVSAPSNASWNRNAHAERAVMNEGGNQGHTHPLGGNTGSANVWPPFIATYMYKRTA